MKTVIVSILCSKLCENFIQFLTFEYIILPCVRFMKLLLVVFIKNEILGSNRKYLVLLQCKCS